MSKPIEDIKPPINPDAPPLGEEAQKPIGPLSEEDTEKLEAAKKLEEEEKKKIEEIMKKNMDAAYTSVVIDPSRQGYYGFAKGIIEKTDEDFATKADKLRAYLESQDADEDEKEKEEVIGAHNTEDHAFKRFRESILKVIGPKKEKDPDKAGDDKEDEEEKEKDVLRSAFLGIIIEKFKFLGDAVPTDDATKTKDVNSLTKSLKDLADEKASEELGLKGFFQAQYDEHRIETGDQLLAAKNKGLTDIQAAKLTMAQDVAVKVAQIAAIALLAGTGAILPAAILAGIMYWWHSRKGNNKGAEPSEEEKLAAEEALRNGVGGNSDFWDDAQDIINNAPIDPKDKPIDPKDAEKAKQAELAKAAQEVKSLEEEYKKLHKELLLGLDGAKERLDLAEKKLQEAAQKSTSKPKLPDELDQLKDVAKKELTDEHEALKKEADSKSEARNKEVAEEIKAANEKQKDPEEPKLDKKALSDQILARQKDDSAVERIIKERETALKSKESDGKTEGRGGA